MEILLSKNSCLVKRTPNFLAHSFDFSVTCNSIEKIGQFFHDLVASHLT